MINNVLVNKNFIEILVFCFELLKIKSKLMFTNTQCSLEKMAS